MKQFLIVSALLISFSTHAQIDSTAAKLQQMKAAIIHMRTELDASHREFRTGTIVTLAGFAVSFVGAVLPSSKITSSGGVIPSDNTMRPILLGVGAGLSIIGTIFMIDSHKHIGRAGKWKFSCDSITMTF